jgi:hypothetical protein
MGFYFFYLVQLATGLLAIFSYKKYASSFFKYFIFYIFCSFISGIFMSIYINDSNNWSWFIFYEFIEFNSVALMYYHLSKEELTIKTIKYVSIGFNGFYLVGIFFAVLQSFIPILLGILVSVFFFLYLRELLNSSRIFIFRTDITFWITIGFLTFYLVSIPFLILLFVFDLKDKIIFHIFQTILTVTHLTFIIGLLCSKTTVKS